MTDNRKQHWIPHSYLKAWVDPDTPLGQTPYLHVFDRYGGKHRRKSPAKIFNMPDLYTIFDGASRDLRIERAFSQWESDFVRVRRLIEAEKFGTGEDAADLYAFAGAMVVRPPHKIDFFTGQWASAAEKIRSIPVNPNASPMPTIFFAKEPGLTLAQVQEMADNPMGTWFPEAVASYVETISRMFGCDIIVNDTEDPFLTSDAPAVIYHPPANDPRRRFLRRGLGSPGCEITLPVSPRLALLFRHKEPGIHSFLNANRQYVFELNFRTITRARANIISDRPDISSVLAITQHVAECDAKTPHA